MYGSEGREWKWSDIMYGTGNRGNEGNRDISSIVLNIYFTVGP